MRAHGPAPDFGKRHIAGYLAFWIAVLLLTYILYEASDLRRSHSLSFRPRLHGIPGLHPSDERGQNEACERGQG